MLRVAGIIEESIVDGDGWRYTIFFQGCKHYCKECQNPQTWDMDAGKGCSPDDIISLVGKAFNDNILLDGVTLSGGDPFYQPIDEMVYLCKELHKQGINIWAYSGFTYDEIIADTELSKLLNEIDVLVDGRFMLELKTLEKKYVGSSNQRIINVKESLKNGDVVEMFLT